MGAFMDAFPSRREAKRRELLQRQDAVVAALDRAAAKLRAGGGEVRHPIERVCRGSRAPSTRSICAC